MAALATSESAATAQNWGASEWRSFPPLYTLQPVESTRLQQLKIWVDLVHLWSTEHRQSRFVLHECPVFENKAISRRLPREGIEAVAGALLLDGRAERREEQIQLYEKRPEDLALEFYEFVVNNDMLNGVYTIFELYTDSLGPFRNVDPVLVRKALDILERDHKCQVFSGTTTDDEGVKFFPVEDDKK